MKITLENRLGHLIIFSFSILLFSSCNVATKDTSTLKSLAEQGDAVAQYDLGLLYYKGSGVNQDFKEALKWFRRSAEQGNAESIFQISEMYFWEEGVEKNHKKAVNWCFEAANNGYWKAQCTMASRYPDYKEVLYSDVVRDTLSIRIEEYIWFWVCDHNTDTPYEVKNNANLSLSALSSRLSTGQVEYAEAMARELHSNINSSAVDQNNEDIMEQVVSDFTENKLIQNGAHLLCDQIVYNKCFKISESDCLEDLTPFIEKCYNDSVDTYGNENIYNDETMAKIGVYFVLCMVGNHLSLYSENGPYITECMEFNELDEETLMKSYLK